MNVNNNHILEIENWIKNPLENKEILSLLSDPLKSQYLTHKSETCSLHQLATELLKAYEYDREFSENPLKAKKIVDFANFLSKTGIIHPLVDKIKNISENLKKSLLTLFARHITEEKKVGESFLHAPVRSFADENWKNIILTCLEGEGFWLCFDLLNPSSTMYLLPLLAEYAARVPDLHIRLKEIIEQKIEYPEKFAHAKALLNHPFINPYIFDHIKNLEHLLTLPLETQQFDYYKTSANDPLKRNFFKYNGEICTLFDLVNEFLIFSELNDDFSNITYQKKTILFSEYLNDVISRMEHFTIFKNQHPIVGQISTLAEQARHNLLNECLDSNFSLSQNAKKEIDLSLIINHENFWEFFESLEEENFTKMLPLLTAYASRIPNVHKMIANALLKVNQDQKFIYKLLSFINHDSNFLEHILAQLNSERNFLYGVTIIRQGEKVRAILSKTLENLPEGILAKFNHEYVIESDDLFSKLIVNFSDYGFKGGKVLAFEYLSYSIKQNLLNNPFTIACIKFVIDEIDMYTLDLKELAILCVISKCNPALEEIREKLSERFKDKYCIVYLPENQNVDSLEVMVLDKLLVGEAGEYFEKILFGNFQESLQKNFLVSPDYDLIVLSKFLGESKIRVNRKGEVKTRSRISSKNWVDLLLLSDKYCLTSVFKEIDEWLKKQWNRSLDSTYKTFRELDKILNFSEDLLEINQSQATKEAKKVDFLRHACRRFELSSVLQSLNSNFKFTDITSDELVIYCNKIMMTEYSLSAAFNECLKRIVYLEGYKEVKDREEKNKTYEALKTVDKLNKALKKIGSKIKKIELENLITNALIDIVYNHKNVKTIRTQIARIILNACPNITSLKIINESNKLRPSKDVITSIFNLKKLKKISINFTNIYSNKTTFEIMSLIDENISQSKKLKHVVFENRRSIYNYKGIDINYHIKCIHGILNKAKNIKKVTINGLLIDIEKIINTLPDNVREIDIDFIENSDNQQRKEKFSAIIIDLIKKGIKVRFPKMSKFNSYYDLPFMKPFMEAVPDMFEELFPVLVEFDWHSVPTSLSQFNDLLTIQQKIQSRQGFVNTISLSRDYLYLLKMNQFETRNEKEILMKFVSLMSSVNVLFTRFLYTNGFSTILKDGNLIFDKLLKKEEDISIELGFENKSLFFDKKQTQSSSSDLLDSVKELSRNLHKFEINFKNFISGKLHIDDLEKIISISLFVNSFKLNLQKNTTEHVVTSEIIIYLDKLLNYYEEIKAFLMQEGKMSD